MTNRISLILFVAATPAAAFQLETAFTDGCHEEMTRGAIAVAGWPDGATPPPLTDDDRRVLANLPFATTTSDDMWLAAALIGTRDNDLHGVEIFDFSKFGEVHQSERYQEEHCLRAPDDDDERGDARALLACRNFILAELALALAEDLEATEPVDVVMKHQTGALHVQRYAFHLGRALHALQDSVSHTLRDPETRAVRHVLNYVDPATAPDYDPHRDGYPHHSDFDDCRDPDNAERTDLAHEASVALVTTIVSGGDRGDRLAQAAAFLDAHLEHDSRCTPENNWCGAVDELPAPQSCAQASHAPTIALLALVSLPLMRRRRRRFAMMISMLGALHVALPAVAQPEVGVNGKLGMALDNGGVATSMGARWRPYDAFSLGVDVEMNPWIDFATGSVAAGTANVALSATYDWIEIGGASIRSGVSAGASMLLFDAAGARAGDIGPYLGVSLLGLSLPIGEKASFDIDPLAATLSVPHVGGVPLAYKQYRFNVGVTWML